MHAIAYSMAAWLAAILLGTIATLAAMPTAVVLAAAGTGLVLGPVALAFLLEYRATSPRRQHRP